jgi:hypothetical protein
MISEASLFHNPVSTNQYVRGIIASVLSIFPSRCCSRFRAIFNDGSMTISTKVVLFGRNVEAALWLIIS